jgi:arsenate reductase
VKKFYQFENCKACHKVAEALQLGDDVEYRDIKEQPVTADELEQLRNLAGSYEALLSKKSVKFKMEGHHKEELTEDQYRDFLLEEYTYFKRPILVIDDQIFIGSDEEVVEAAKKALG